MNLKIFPTIDENSKAELKEYSPILQQLLFNRGIKTKPEAEKFLNPLLDHLHDSLLLTDVNKAIDRILKARENKEKVFIYGDYDVDGVSATSLLWDFLYRKLGINVLPYIPSRFEEGYGLNPKGLDYILKEQGNLIVTVDCGVRDIELIREYKEKGIDFIITDHHTIATDEDGDPITSKEAEAVVHPRHPDSQYPFHDICGAAVAWKLVDAIYKYCSTKNLIDFGSFHPNDYMDIVSLATVTDIMPLVDENRVILRHGITKMKSTKNIGLRTLMLESQIDPDEVDAYHYGFVLGPRLNAAGRIDSALDAVRLLSTTNIDQAMDYARKLSTLNIQRQNLTSEILETAKRQLSQSDQNHKLYFTWGHEWPEGVVGLVAGKLQEEFYRPVLVATIKDGIATGSARSLSSFNITDAISQSSHLLKRFGGHAQAAGFTLEEINLEQFKNNLITLANSSIKDEDLTQELSVDMELNIDDISFDLLDELQQMAPFGMANRTPTFIFKDCKIIKKMYLGKEQKHIKLIVRSSSGFEVEILAFGRAPEFQDVEEGDTIDVIGTLDRNFWNGRDTAQIKLKEFIKH